MVFKLFTTFILVDCQFLPSWLHPSMEHLLEVIIPVFIEFTSTYVITRSAKSSRLLTTINNIPRELHQF